MKEKKWKQLRARSPVHLPSSVFSFSKKIISCLPQALKDVDDDPLQLGHAHFSVCPSNNKTEEDYCGAEVWVTG